MTRPKSYSVAPDGADASSTRNDFGMRIASALALAAFALALVKAGPWPFLALVIATAWIASWEWGRLVRHRQSRLILGLHCVAIGAAAMVTAFALVGIGFGLLLAGALAVGFLARAEGTPQAVWSSAGVFYIGLPALALIWLRLDAVHGWIAIIFLFLVVWSTDIGAYFIGRVAGGPRLAPRISPNKTWSGAFGGVALSALAAFWFTRWLGGTSVLSLSMVAVVLSVVAQLGDLAESAIKRKFDVKDASRLIPGHGGVLDRIDALLFAALAAAALALVRTPSEPGHALLIWP